MDKTEFTEQFKARHQSKTKEIFSLFIPTRELLLTPLIIDLNILIFIIMTLAGADAFFPTSEDLIYRGGNLRQLTLNGEPWRLFTSCFLHCGIIHLVLNMLVLMRIGIYLEPLLGIKRFLCLYILSGLFASTSSVALNENIVSAGASGAILGLYGAFLSILLTDVFAKDVRKELLKGTLFFVLMNLGYGITEGIDNAAHIGGLTSGLVIGISFYPSLREKGTLFFTEIRSILLLSGSFIILILLILTFTPNYTHNVTSLFEKYLIMDPEGLIKYDKDLNKTDFERMIQKLVINEAIALEIYTAPRLYSDENLSYQINNLGIYYWDKNIEIINQDSSKNIFANEGQLHLYEILVKYYELRKESYNRLLQSFEGDSEYISTKEDAVNYLLTSYLYMLEENIAIYKTIMKDRKSNGAIEERINLKVEFSQLLSENIQKIINEINNYENVDVSQLQKNRKKMEDILKKLYLSKDMIPVS